MNYALDIAVAAAVIICVCVGAHRGAVRTLISAAGYIAAFAAAVFLSNAADDYVYDNFVRPSVISAMESKAEELENTYASPESLKGLLEENGVILSQEEEDALESVINNREALAEVLTNEEIRGKMNSVFIGYCHTLTETFSGVLPAEITEEAERYIEGIDKKNNDISENVTEERQSVTDIIEREVVRPVMMKTVNSAIFALTFAVVCIIAGIVLRAVGLIRRIPAVRSADGLAGSLLGLLHGILITAVICVLASIFIKLTADENSYLNSAVISQTIIFKHFYSGIFYVFSFLLKY